MKKFIYKYENKVNHKVYIGQTNDVRRRFSEHLYGHSYQTSLIERAIKKYGIENFEFEVLEETDIPNERERYWIDHYHSYKPYGYNICEGGGYLPNQQKENHSQAKISEETARMIQEDLANLALPKPAIVKKYKVTYAIVNNINNGHTWNYYGLTYPIRPSEAEIKCQRADKVIQLLQNTILSFKEIGRRVGWGESQVSMINVGKNYPQEGIKYPIRKDPKDYSDKIETCIQLLKQGKSNGFIANQLGTSIAWVSRVNTGKTHKQKNLVYPIRK